jgi:uncharacterized protein (TIGR03437 family)
MRHWIFLAAVAASAQNLSYSRLPSTSTPPSPRVDGTIVYDVPGRQLFLFGGQDTSPRNDLWSYSLDQNQWREVPQPANRPAPRFGHTLVFDSLRRRLILFGGQAGGFFNDTWAFDIATNTWSKLSPGGALPNERYGHSGIYDATRDRLVISHGFTDDGRFDDTWAFEFAANRWRNISPPSNRPLRRCLHHAVYDPIGEQMLLFGGCASGFGPCPLGDLWAFDLASNRWTEKMAQPSPSPRQHYGVAYDTVRNRMVVFGGAGGGVLNDTWEYDPRAGTWQQLAILDPPSGRNRVEAAFAADRGALYLFGGSTASGNSNELWALSTVEVRAPVVSNGGIVNAFSGGTGGFAPGEIVSIFGENLGPVDGIATAYDTTTNRLPNSAANVAVTWNGIGAPLYFVRHDQVNAQVPYELNGASEAQLIIQRDGRSSAAKIVAIVPTHPGLFPAVWNQDGSVNSPANPATPGSIVILYATGQGVTGPASVTGAAALDLFPDPVAPVRLEVGGASAEILFRGQAPGTTGVMQINARVPPGLAGTLPLKLTVGSASSQTGVFLEVR